MSDLQHVPAPRTTGAAARERLGDELAILKDRAGHRVTRKAALTTGAISVAALSMGAGAAYVASAPAPDKTVVHCYNSASTAHHALGTDTNYLPGVSDPILTCANLWRIGAVQPGVFQAQPTVPDAPERPVPRLVACTMHGGIAAVFPGDTTTCRRLGLPVLRP